MADIIESYLQQHIAVAQRVITDLTPTIDKLGKLLCDTFAAGGKVITFGNGGSAADAQHFAEELIGRYLRTRRPLPAISINSDGPAMTCIANDFGYEEIFARQVTALAAKGDLVFGFSTSGNSENVLRGMRAARARGAIAVGMLGRAGGKAAAEADHAIIVPARVTSHIQEMHYVILHILCDIVDRWAESSERKS